jgi:Peptidase family M48
MHSLKCLLVALAFSAIAQAATAQQPTIESEVINRILAQEHVEMHLLRQYSPVVETYIQYVRTDKQFGEVPDGDKYFLGRARLANGVELEPLRRDASVKQKIFGGWGEFFSMEFLPRGFLQMIYLDTTGFDRVHYKFEYVGREFLGEVRCLVFNVNPLPKAGKGRFVGRIWVEDQDFNIVRFNGAYGGASLTSNYFNFESWRMNVGKNLWLPAFIYSEGPSVDDTKARDLGFKAFKAQTRLWGYNIGNVPEERELSKALKETLTPVADQSETASDYSPLQAERSWGLEAEDNVTDRLERQGLMAPSGEVEKILETVASNLEVTNGLDIQPAVRCRILMTSTLESFTIGHTIVLSRGLIDVLPDEASLAAILAHELGHVLLRHRMETQFAFFSRLQFDEKGTFRHFEFAHTAEEEHAANQKGIELLSNSPYKEQSGTVQLFLQALKDRSKQIPNLVSPHLGDRVETGWIDSSAEAEQSSDAKQVKNVIAALPLGGRIKVDPWNDQLTMLKAKPVIAVAEDEERPFQITPFVFYLTRPGARSLAQATDTAPAELELGKKP